MLAGQSELSFSLGTEQRRVAIIKALPLIDDLPRLVGCAAMTGLCWSGMGCRIHWDPQTAPSARSNAVFVAFDLDHSAVWGWGLTFF